MGILGGEYWRESEFTLLIYMGTDLYCCLPMLLPLGERGKYTCTQFVNQMDPISLVTQVTEIQDRLIEDSHMQSYLMRVQENARSLW